MLTEFGGPWCGEWADSSCDDELADEEGNATCVDIAFGDAGAAGDLVDRR